MRRYLFPLLLVVITVLLALRASSPYAALGFGVLTYGAYGFMRHGLAGIREREVILPSRYGREFHYTGGAAVAQGWLRVGIGVALLVVAITLGVAALA